MPVASFACLQDSKLGVLHRRIQRHYLYMLAPAFGGFVVRVSLCAIAVIHEVDATPEPAYVFSFIVVEVERFDVGNVGSMKE